MLKIKQKSPVFAAAYISAVIMVVLLATGPSSAQIDSPNYVLGPKDVIDIQVYEQEDLRSQVRLSEEGKISLPLIGEVKASGHTIDELTKIITEKYKEYIYTPQISVFIKEYHSMQIYLLGEIQKPGVYQLTGNSTLLELISQAGGVTEGGGDTLTIIRRASKGVETEPITMNLKKLLDGSNEGYNVTVMDGDTIYVPRADYFFVFGEVRKPGSYKLEKDLMITVLKAISLAGGFTEKAAKKKIRVTREENGVQMNYKADFNTEVRPHDIIIVPESFF